MKMQRWLGVAIAAAMFAMPVVADAGPPPIDPKQMSGLSRPDPAVPAGTVTVRVLEGGFDAPSVGAEVTLELVGTDGNEETRKATAQAPDGRAVFDGLEAFVGGHAVASVTFDGQPVSSQPIPIGKQQGSRVMLVKGAQAPTAPTSTAETPIPGHAFAMPNAPRGRLMVGTFDLGARKPIANVEVTLTITPPEGEPQTKSLESDAQGRVIFERLESFPKGTRFTVEGVLVEGEEPKRSEPFELDDDSGMAVVLAVGQMPPRSARQGPARLPGPRILPSIPVGTVRVRVVDAQDQPVPDAEVEVIKRAAGGSVETFAGRTGPDGVATIENVEARDDSVYSTEVRHGGAPWRSSLFGLDRRGGVQVEQRVFATTNDRSKVASELKLAFEPRENDLAEIVQIYAVAVSGEEAFWDPEFQITGMDGAMSFSVLPRAEQWLAHEEKAPFATLAGPIPPGQIAELSVAYLLEHDGDVEFRWPLPFDAQVFAIVDESLEFEADGATPAQNQPIPEAVAYDLGERRGGVPLELTVDEFPVRNPVYRYIALAGLVATLAALGGALLFRTRRSSKEVLLARKEELIALLARLDRDEAGDATRRRLLAALDQTDRKLRALERIERPSKE